MNLAELLAGRAEPLGERIAIDFEGERISYAALFDAVRRRATFLDHQGIQPGDSVALMLPKGLESVYFHLAALSVGAVSLPLNDASSPGELGYFLADSGAALLVTYQAGCRRADRVLRSLKEGMVVAVDGDPSIPGFAPREGMAKRDALDTAMICYTSGTTGRPKGAMLTHGNLLQNMKALHREWRWRPDDVLLHGLPLFHIHGLIVAIHGALHAGATVRMLEKFDAGRVSRELAAGECTLFMGVPTMYRRLVDLWEAEGQASGLSAMRLFICGSAPLPPALFERFRELAGHTILERYGMTETGIISSNPYDPGERKPGSVGYPLEGVGVRIRGEEGKEVPPGEVGEVQVKGFNVFKGYWKAPHKTASSFDGEWFRTGDLGRLDPADGNRLYLHGRRRELIITGGLNVYPQEVEEVFESRPDIKEAAVLGIEDAEWGERVVAIVVPAETGSLDKEALFEFLKTRLAPYKCPKQIIFRDSLPRNSMGKVMKSLIRV